MAGYREFQTGEVLTAANVNNFLMKQTVMVFSSSAARASAIGTPNEGMVSYLTDTDAVEVYDGSGWISVAPTPPSPVALILAFGG